ncbi:hypothetical protein FS749_016776 [Ceratobasidium sp. UAMH 11750]|nr:hypothetical protein FS749_016776 [Ceratobasidium sp. UAMH 11750]
MDPPSTSHAASHTMPTSLSPAQLRRLGDYLENKCLELTRGVRKRNEPDAPYATLSAYISAASSLVSMVLLIPPLEPSASIRTSRLLRITGDIFENIPAYPLGSQPTTTPDPTDDNGDLNPPQLTLTDEGLSTLEEVFQLLEKLDEGWCAVIRNERWDPTLNHGIFSQSPTPGDSIQPGPGAFSVTDSTRLRSLIISGKDEFDDWLAEQGGASNFEVADRSIRVMSRTLREIGQVIPAPVQPEPDPQDPDSDSDSI